MTAAVVPERDTALSAQGTALEAGAAVIEARLVGIAFVVEGITQFEFARADGGPLPPAEPGAHLGIILPNGMQRQYSLLRAESAPSRYAIAVKREESGQGASIYMHDRLRIGTRLRLTLPRNNFVLEESANNTIFMAGGIGITPIWCMIQRMEALGRPWQLRYACRCREMAAFYPELQATGKARFHFDNEYAGRPLDVAKVVRHAPADAHLYCCGPAPMLKAFEKATADWPRGQIHVEYFGAKYDQNTSGGYVVELARSGRQFVIPPGKTILEVLVEAGVPVLSSCERGVCGACETAVLSGVPDHRDSILSDEEKAAGKSMFICCSGAKSERLVLDL